MQNIYLHLWIFNYGYSLKKKKEILNLLELTPVRNRESITDEAGFVKILEPKFTNKILVKHLVPRLKSKFIKIKLDKMGSETWNLMNGEDNVEIICKKLREKFGTEMLQIEERVTKFISELHIHDVVKFKEIN